ncbi:MAG TPA: methyltransferase domain-containing protein [Verrucomicrobiae bacterium]|nr:methyltransferase domain-containing protein [Verrucomicrobiae bacterium]
MLKNKVRLRRRAGRVDLEVAGASFSSWHPRLLMTGLAWDAITAACLLRPAGPPATVLMLGLGGGTVARQLRAVSPETRVTAVELDAGVVAMAREHMGLDGLGVEAVIADAYDFVLRDRRRYDVLIDDLYVTGREDVWRPRPPDGDLLALYRRRLSPGGLVVVNMIIGPGHRRVQSTVRREMGQAFSEVRSVRSAEGMNEVLVGGDCVLPGGTLRHFGGRIQEEKDRRFWEGIRVERLRRR